MEVYIMTTVKNAENAPVKFLSKVVGDGGVTFCLGNGQTLEALLDDYPSHIQHQLALHGLSQKIGDSAAGCAKDKAYGAALAAMTAVNAALKAGKWGAERESGGGMLIQDLITAIARLKKLDLEAVAGAVRVADEATVKGWLKNVRIDAEIKALRLARAKAAARDSEEDFEFTL